MRRTLACLVFVAALTACGDTTPDTVPYRESIDPAREAEVAKRKLAARDAPLPVGATAPAFDALPADTPVIVVFYRGHW